MASLASLALAGTAAAVTTDHYLQGQGLGPGNTFAGYNAHTNPYQSVVTSDHTACPAYDVGHGGYFSGAPADFVLSVCGPGTTYWNVGHGGSWHGAVFNPQRGHDRSDRRHLRGVVANMSLSLRSSLGTLAASLAAVSATAGALFALGGHPATSHADAAVDVDAVVSHLAKHYPVLGHPGSGKDLATDRPISSAKFAESVPGLIAARGRLLDRDAEKTLLLVPRADGQVCIEALFADGTAGGNCNSTGQSPVLVTYGKAVGVVPASVSELTYTLANGKTVSGAPDENGFYTAPAEAQSVSYDDGSGPQTIDLMPASAKPADTSVPAL